MLFTLEVRVTGIWNLAKLLRKLISMFSSFVSAGVEFHVLASFLVCWLDGCASLGKLRCLS